MSLHIYTDKTKVPKDLIIVHDNDSFFEVNTSLKDCDFVRDVITIIDKSEYYDEDTFRSGLGNKSLIPSSNLSTGSKTLINLYSHPDEYCFNLCECGNNALELITKLHQGYALFELPFIAYMLDDESCDIIHDGIHYTNIFDFLEAVFDD